MISSVTSTAFLNPPARKLNKATNPNLPIDIMKLFAPILLFASLLMPVFVHAQTGTVDTAAIQARMKSRLPDLAKLKESGKIGEAFNGMVAIRQDVTDEEKEMVSGENKDRLEVYKYMATKFDVSPKQVALSRHSKIKKAAKPGTWFKDKAGKWSQKE